MAAMTLTERPSDILTWEDYLSEEHIEGRYDIIEGIRYFMAGVSWEHQRVSYNVIAILRLYERQQQTTKALYAPFDVLIRRIPRLQVRQPDVFLIRNATLARAGGIPSGTLTVAPELVVEIISDSETASRLNSKMTDYAEIGVAEAWIVRPEDQTVEVQQLVGGNWQSVDVYTAQDTLQSVVFPDLTAPVGDFFLP